MTLIWLFGFFSVKDYNITDNPNSKEESAKSSAWKKITFKYLQKKIFEVLQTALPCYLERRNAQKMLCDNNRVSWMLFWVITKNVLH